LDRTIHLPPTLGYAPRRLEEGEFSPTFVKDDVPVLYDFVYICRHIDDFIREEFVTIESIE